MATALRTSSSGFGGATFEVDRLDVDEGILTIEGTWSGVRGMRFVRPTLVVDDRQVLATLEHKPWAPRDDAPWTAAFPWTGDATALAAASLEVAPSVIVPLGPFAGSGNKTGRTGAPAPPEAAPPEAAPPEQQTSARGEHRDSELRALRREMLALQSRADDAARAQRTAESDRDRALAMRDEAVRDLEAALRTRDRMDGRRDEALAAVTATERERDEAIGAAQRQRDDAIAAAQRQRDKALAASERDRDKAITAARRERDEAVAAAEHARAAALAERDATMTERDELRAQRDELRAQRDEILLAHRTLEQQLRSVRAGHEPMAEPASDPERAAPRGERERATAREERERAAPRAEGDEPIGIRSIPAARTAAADLLGPRRDGRADLSTFDLWTMRLLGTTAAICFVLLLLMLLRVFL